MRQGFERIYDIHSFVIEHDIKIIQYWNHVATDKWADNCSFNILFLQFRKAKSTASIFARSQSMV